MVAGVPVRRRCSPGRPGKTTFSGLEEGIPQGLVRRDPRRSWTQTPPTGRSPSAPSPWALAAWCPGQSNRSLTGSVVEKLTRPIADSPNFSCSSSITRGRCRWSRPPDGRNFGIWQTISICRRCSGVRMPSIREPGDDAPSWPRRSMTGTLDRSRVRPGRHPPPEILPPGTSLASEAAVHSWGVDGDERALRHGSVPA